MSKKTEQADLWEINNKTKDFSLSCSSDSSNFGEPPKNKPNILSFLIKFFSTGGLYIVIIVTLINIVFSKCIHIRMKRIADSMSQGYESYSEAFEDIYTKSTYRIMDSSAVIFYNKELCIVIDSDNVYHRYSGCDYISNALDNGLPFEAYSIEYADENGYNPCENCYKE